LSASVMSALDSFGRSMGRLGSLWMTVTGAWDLCSLSPWMRPTVALPLERMISRHIVEIHDTHTLR
jgi:hypothetical protein